MENTSHIKGEVAILIYHLCTKGAATTKLPGIHTPAASLVLQYLKLTAVYLLEGEVSEYFVTFSC